MPLPHSGIIDALSSRHGSDDSRPSNTEGVEVCKDTTEFKCNRIAQTVSGGSHVENVDTPDEMSHSSICTGFRLDYGQGLVIPFRNRKSVLRTMEGYGGDGAGDPW